MRFIADLHVHSRYSRATSRDCDPEHLSIWAQKKGLRVLGTGDFTHPRWMEELKSKLVPAEPGLFRLEPGLEKAVGAEVPACCAVPTRFALTVEISTIYKKGDRTRKVHHVVLVPGFEAADRFVARLARVGNLASDGRPILGLDSRHLLEMVLESGPHSYLVPAHIWTPWFSVLGSSSGFDSIEECYGDLSEHVFALETGLSSDPPMNWRVSRLDRYRLVSNSDAHSPAKLGREATSFDCEPDFFAMREALRTGAGYGGTLEFFPEEGKYHLDGHRKCSVCLAPEQTRSCQGICPTCGSRLTIGVMHRVEELADRPESGPQPRTAGPFTALIPLAEILGEIESTGPGSKRVSTLHENLMARLGPELAILRSLPVDEIRKAGPGLLAEAITRLRRGEVIRQAGYDGEYGVIRLFRDEELSRRSRGESLFRAAPGAPEETGRPAAKAPRKRRAAPRPDPDGSPARAVPPATCDASGDIMEGLDPEQRAAVQIAHGPLLILAGPGSGKTRTLTHRIAHLTRSAGVAPGQCLAVTFTRRAAAQMRQRLATLIGEAGERIPTHTFHSLGLEILRARPGSAGLKPDFRVIDEPERIALVAGLEGCSETTAKTRLKAFGQRLRGAQEGGDVDARLAAYSAELRARNVVDFDGLVALAVDLLEKDPLALAPYRDRWVFVDEYQDIDPLQYRLVRLLAGDGHRLCVIGDPDQSIYGFRGADVKLFLGFARDYPDARVVHLNSNYRSGRCIVDASSQVIAPLSPDKLTTRVVADDHRKIVVHEAPTERAEAEFVVHTIEQMIGGHGFFSRDSGRVDGGDEPAFALDEFAVLYRTDAQSAALLEAFERSGLPFQKVSHEPLLQREAVKALVAGIESRAGPVRRRLADAAGALAKADPTSEPRLEAALALVGPMALEFGERVGDFLCALALASETDQLDPRADRITLMTIHASKGLEYPVVFLVGLEDGLLPLRFAPTSPVDLDEERRLLYVGMTRARQRLFLTRAKKRLVRGKVLETVPSPFLTRIEKELLEHRRGQAPRKRPQSGDTQPTLF